MQDYGDVSDLLLKLVENHPRIYDQRSDLDEIFVCVLGLNSFIDLLAELVYSV